MLSYDLSNPALLAEAQETSWHFRLDPAVNLFVLIAGLLVAGGLTCYLYRAQARVASARVIRWLTGLRLLLILLVVALMLRPVQQWNHVSRSGGTLWLLLDQSASMAQADPQSTPLERLRWADALGYLPRSLRTERLDVAAARLVALKGALGPIQNTATAGGEVHLSADKQVPAFVKSIKDWRAQLEEIAQALEKNPNVRPVSGPSGGINSGGINSVGMNILKTLQDATAAVNNGLTQAAGRTLAADAAGDIPWALLRSSLDAAADDCRRLADRADQALLAQHANDAKLAEALQKVSKLSRADLAYQALTGKAVLGKRALADTLAAKDVRVVTFAGTPQLVSASHSEELPALLKRALTPSGPATNIADAMTFVYDQISREPAQGEGQRASVLLVSDGRVNDGGDLVEASRRLAALGAGVSCLGLGSREIMTDAAIDKVDVPAWVHVDDTLKVSAAVRFDGLMGKPVRILFHYDKETMGSQNYTPPSNHVAKVFHFEQKMSDPGRYPFDITVESGVDEANKENNFRAFSVNVKKDKFHVLIVDEQPRWEYRYLVNYFIRDQRIALQTVLLRPGRIQDVAAPSPVKASIANPGVDAQVLPSTRDEWFGFDMIILGDVPPEVLSAKAQADIAAAVNNRGTTLVVVAGPQHMPGRFAGAPLADLLPVQTSGAWSDEALQRHLDQGFRPLLTPAGAASVLGQFSIEEGDNANLWDRVPLWYWHSEQTEAKPAAEVLWSIGDAERPAGNKPASAAKPPAKAADGSNATADAAHQLPNVQRRRALLSSMSLGLGRILYLAGDATWRLRQVEGKNFHERFWGQVISWAVGSDLPAGGKFVRFGSNKSLYATGEPVLVKARVLKEDLTPLGGQSFKVVARATSPQAGQPQKVIAEAKMLDSPDTQGFYQAALTGLPAGLVDLSLEGEPVDRLLANDPSVTQKTLTAEIQAHLSLEDRDLNADPATLARVAMAAGGSALDGPYADILAERIPVYDYRRTTVEQMGMFADPNNPYTRWVHWAFLALFVVIITAEWIIRKSAGLV